MAESAGVGAVERSVRLHEDRSRFLVEFRNVSAHRPFIGRWTATGCTLQPDPPYPYLVLLPGEKASLSVIPPPAGAFSLVLAPPGDALRHKLLFPPHGFTVFLNDLRLDGVADLSRLPEDFQDLRFWLKQARAFTPRASRYVLARDIILAKHAFAAHFAGSMAGFFKNHALELSGGADDGWEGFLALLADYRRWAEADAFHATVSSVVVVLMDLPAFDEARRRRRAELLLRLNEASGDSLEMGRKFRVALRIAADFPESLPARRVLFTLAELLASASDPLLPPSFAEDMAAHPPRSGYGILLKLLDGLMREREPKWRLIHQIASALVSVKTPVQRRTEGIALFAAANLRFYEHEDFAGAARLAARADETLRPEDAYLADKARILHGSARARHVARHEDAGAAVELLAQLVEEARRAPFHENLSAMWRTRLARELILLKLDGMDLLWDNDAAQGLCRELARLEVEAYGKPRPLTLHLRNLTTYCRLLLEGRFREASGLARKIAEKNRAEGRSGAGPEIGALASLAARAIGAGKLDEFGEHVERMRHIVGGHLLRLDHVHRLPAICDISWAAIAAGGGGERPPDEVLDAWTRGAQEAKHLTPALRKSLLHLLHMMKHAAPEEAREILPRDYVTELASLTVRVALRQEAGNAGETALRAALHQRRLLAAAPAKYLRELEELEVIASAQTRPGRVVAWRHLAILDGMLADVIAFAAARHGPSPILTQALEGSFGTRLAALGALHLARRPRDDLDLERLVRFRNDEGHGRLGKWDDEQVAAIHADAVELTDVILASLPAFGRSRGRNDFGYAMVELDWGIPTKLLYVKGADLPAGTAVMLDKPALLDAIAKGGSRVLDEGAVAVVPRPD